MPFLRRTATSTTKNTKSTNAQHKYYYNNDALSSEQVAEKRREEEHVISKMQRRAIAPPSGEYPRAGSWVAFKLNAGFWAHLFTDEDHPTRHPDVLARFALSFQYYIGLVAGCYEVTVPATGEKYLELVVLYLKPAEEDELSNPLRRDPLTRAQYEMTAPVGWNPTPNTLERDPLRSTIFLPWQRAAQMTACGTRLRVQKMHNSTLEFAVDLDDFERFEEMVETDLRTLQNLAKYRGLPKYSELDVPLLGIPADIWKDVRVCDGAFPPDPQEYLEEIRDLQRLLSS